MTENGYGDYPNTPLEDTGRINFHCLYINEMLKSVLLDGTKVKSYSVWSLMDNFQFTFGYTSTYGVYKVDFNHPARPRTAKASAAFLKQIFSNNGFPAENYAF